VFAAFIDPAVIAAAVQKENIQLTEIEIMLYDDRYLRRSQFPKEIVVHLFILHIEINMIKSILLLLEIRQSLVNCA
jgi:hypothetical protein